MTTTPKVGVTEWASAQATPDVTVNAAFRKLEQGARFYVVKDKDLTSAPGSPADGDCYIVATAGGAWSTFAAKDLAYYQSSAWVKVTPEEGVFAWVQDENLLYYYNGSAWASYSTGAGLGDVVGPASSTNLHIAQFDGTTGKLLKDGGALGSAAAIDIDTDGTLAANSDAKIATQKATKTYVDAAVTGLLDYKGVTDCSANPNYPAASKGDAYIVSVAGKIGGASGTSVDAGDWFIAKADNAGGTEASVGSSWGHVEHNLVISDVAYDATSWDGNTDAPTKNAVRDKIEAIVAGAGSAASTTEQLTGTDSTKLATPDSVAALWEQGADVASAGTTSLGEGGYFNITGTTTITDIDFATDKAGRRAWVRFAGALTLTYNASTLILPTGASITTAAGDTAEFVSEGSDVVRCVAYTRASGAALSATGGTGKYFDYFRPTDNEPPTSNYATLDLRNNHPVLEFDTTTQEAAIFSGVLPATYAGGGLTVTAIWCADTATSGTIGWDVAIERVGTAQDIDSDSFATALTITAATVSGTSGICSSTSVNLASGADMDSLAAGEAYRIRIRRDVANDTATGDAQLIRLVVVEQ